MNPNVPTHVLLAVNHYPEYYSCYPLVKLAWERIIGLKCVLVFVGDKVPKYLSSIENNIIHIQETQHSVFFAQNARLVLPAYLNVEGSILISDIDMAPLSRSFFIQPPLLPTDEGFLTYRDVLIETDRQVAMCYNSAPRRIWQDLLGDFYVPDPKDALRRMLKVCGQHDGQSGGLGWFFDQKFLYHRLTSPRKFNWYINKDLESKFKRLDRIFGETNLRQWVHQGFYNKESFTDFHLLMPNEKYMEINEQIIFEYIN